MLFTHVSRIHNRFDIKNFVDNERPFSDVFVLFSAHFKPCNATYKLLGSNSNTQHLPLEKNHVQKKGKGSTNRN